VTVGLPVNTPQQIGQLVPGGTVKTLDRPAGTDPFGVAFGIDGAFWVAEFAAQRLERVTTDGQATPLNGFPTDLAGRGPRQITAGPNNTLWTTLDDPGDDTQSLIAKISGLQPPTTAGGGGGGGGGGGTPPPPPDTTAPVVTGLKLSKTKIRRGTKTITLRFTSTEAGTAQVILNRRLPGRRRGAACVQPTHRLRKAKRCTRNVRVRTIRQSVVAGANTIRLTVKGLPVGRYVVALLDLDAAGNQATTPALTLTIRRR
jgi:hypothetical protein